MTQNKHFKATFNPFEGYPQDKPEREKRKNREIPLPKRPTPKSRLQDTKDGNVLPISTLSPLLLQVSDMQEARFYRRAQVGQGRGHDFPNTKAFGRPREKDPFGVKECIKQPNAMQEPAKQEKKRLEPSEPVVRNNLTKYDQGKMKEILQRSPYQQARLVPTYERAIKDRQIHILGKSINRHTTDHLAKDYTFGKGIERDNINMSDLLAASWTTTDVSKSQPKEKGKLDMLYSGQNAQYGFFPLATPRAPVFQPKKKIASVSMRPSSVKDCISPSASSIYGQDFIDFRAKRRAAWS